MPSQLAWLDRDDEQRKRMLVAIELLKEEGTVDELGVGTIRDAIAAVLFPGMSVLHTRARYLLFVPWLLQAAVESANGSSGPVELRKLEVRLIHALLSGGETDGVIGSQAKDKLKRMPSAAYWAATYRYGLRTLDTTLEGFFRRSRPRDQRRRDPLDELTTTTAMNTGLHPDLPPMPAELLKTATFTVSPDEADFLRDRFLATAAGSLLHWLVAANAPSSVERIWQHPRQAEFPADLRTLVDHGRRFATTIHGAPLLYNLMLAEKQESSSVEHYRERLDSWRAELSATRVLNSWDPAGLWDALDRAGQPARAGSRRFAQSWLSIVSDDSRVDDDERARDLIRKREFQLKGPRARLYNPSALDNWRGNSGLVPLDYNWLVARRLLNDFLSVTPQAAI